MAASTEVQDVHQLRRTFRLLSSVWPRKTEGGVIGGFREQRFVRTIRENCLGQMIFFGEDALRNTIREFVTHYHLERNHQGLDNRLIVPMKTIPTNGTIRRLCFAKNPSAITSVGGRTQSSKY